LGTFFVALLLGLAVAITIPMAVVALEALAAVLPPKGEQPYLSADRPCCAILIPAHDEEALIGNTVRTVLRQLLPRDRLLVVADNCSDRTVEVARLYGGTVVERRDSSRRGKGFALEFGVNCLASDPPHVVIVVDADCSMEDGAIDRLVRECAARECPVQGLYQIDLPPKAGFRQRVSWFAFQFKNHIRPLGLRRLGLPCLLMGTGMAFPWRIICDAPLGSGNIAEDTQLGVDLALAGHTPRFCPQAEVKSRFPVGQRAAWVQRTRWEHGHLRTILTQFPRLLFAAVRQRRVDLVGLALELSVPPLSMLFILWAVAGISSGILWWWQQSYGPAMILACSGIAAGIAILAAWLKFGRGSLPLTSLLAAPIYALWKVPIYMRFIFRPQRSWVRTARSGMAPNETHG
jgi:cellulose synthase/poly-beta-1,6-N-acetylglucosamine synthase-like glycosyltransferase